MYNTKYIMFDWPGKGMIPIVFPASIEHSTIKNIVCTEHTGITAVSAGFVKNSNGRFYAVGYSQSLNLNSNPDIDNIYLNILKVE